MIFLVLIWEKGKKKDIGRQLHLQYSNTVYEACKITAHFKMFDYAHCFQTIIITYAAY